MTEPSRHSVSVAGVITDAEGRVLVIQRRDNGQWQIPGGVLELDESVPAGLRREVEEETGLLVEPIRLTGVYKNIRLGVIALVFQAHVLSGHARPTEESAEVEWWTSEAVRTKMARVFAVRVADALSGGAPSVRMHDGVNLIADTDTSQPAD